MANEIIERDQNSVTVLAGITNDSAQEIRMLRVDPTTGRLLANATGGSSIELETNGTPNGDQTLLNLVEGTNITLTDDGMGSVTIDSTASGAVWGAITGTLSDQTDLQNALDAKANTALSNLASVAINTSLLPGSNDGAALGTGTLAFSDLFLASGGVINFNNSNWIATHTSGILTVGTGDLRVTTAGTNTASVVTVGGTQTLTNKTVRFANPGILDSNGDTMLAVIPGGASIANNFTITNATSANSPTLSVAGSGSNIGMNFSMKGTGAFNILGNSTQSAQLRLYEDTDDGSNYTALKVGTQSGDITYTLPTSLGSAGQVLTDAAGNGVLSWEDGGGVSFGSDNQIPYTNAAGDDFDYSANLTFDGTLQTITDSTIGAALTATSGLLVQNTATASSGNQKYSPPIVHTGQGWATGSGGSSQSFAIANYVTPIQGTTFPTGSMLWAYNINGGGWNTVMTLNIATTGAYLTVQNIRTAANGIFDTNYSGGSAAADFAAFGATVSSANDARLTFSGATNVNARSWMSGNAVSITANNSFANHIIGSTACTEASSGTHALIAGLVVKAPVITGGSATVTNTATVYIPSAPSTTVSGGNYAVWVDDGDVKVDANVDAGTYSVGGSAGASGSFTTTDGKTVTVTNGLITSIV